MVKFFILMLLTTALFAQDEIQTSEIPTHIIFLKKGTPLIEINTNKMVKNADDIYLKANKGFDKEGYSTILDKNDKAVYKVDFKYIKQNNTITDMRAVPDRFNTNYVRDENVYTHFKESSIFFEMGTGVGSAKYSYLESDYPIFSDVMVNLYLKWKYALEMGGGYEFSYAFINSGENKYTANNHYIGAILRYPLYQEDPVTFYFGLKFYQGLNLVVMDKTTSENYSFDSQKIGSFMQVALKTSLVRVNLGVNYDREWMTSKNSGVGGTNNILLFTLGLDYEWLL